MQRVRALLAGLCLTIACQGTHQPSRTPIAATPSDFTGSWVLQLVVFQDECGFCVSGTPIRLESLTITQMQSSVVASLRGDLDAELSGSVTGSVVDLTSNNALYVNDWYFVDSSTKGFLSLSNGAVDGAFFIEMGQLGECCGKCCQEGQCLCRDKSCRVPLPGCKMSFQFTGYRIPS